MAETTEVEIEGRTVIRISRVEMVRIIREYVQGLGLRGCPDDPQQIGVMDAEPTIASFTHGEVRNG